MAKYPLGIQTFSQIREEGYAYVDKTEYVFRLANEGKYYFLSRPRRFGKSLLLSTIQAYFEGRKELFGGLAIDSLEEKWISYPVLRFDFSGSQANELEKFEKSVLADIEKYAKKYGVALPSDDIGMGPLFGHLLEGIAEAAGRRVVVLIDEYDNSLLKVLENEKALIENTSKLQSFFTQIKRNDEHIKFVMITGVARFHHLTLFSGFNNLTDISLEEDFASICGITQRELEANFSEGVSQIAEKMDISYEEALQRMRQKYDSYRFSDGEEKVYNPYSLLRALKGKRIGSYWLQTTTSRVFLSFLKKSNFKLDRLENLWATDNELASMYSADSPVAMLYQTGYLTIKEYKNGRYRLGIPNGEVRAALVEELMPNYMGVNNSDINFQLNELGELLRRGAVDEVMLNLKSLIAGIPYHEFDTDNVEKTYHLTIYLIFLMMGIEVRNEISMSGGRIDMVANTSAFVYVFEFKLNGTALQALGQIEDRGYAIPWEASNRKVIKVGVSFSSTTRTIEDWVVA